MYYITSSINSNRDFFGKIRCTKLYKIVNERYSLKNNIVLHEPFHTHVLIIIIIITIIIIIICNSNPWKCDSDSILIEIIIFKYICIDISQSCRKYSVNRSWYTYILTYVSVAILYYIYNYYVETNESVKLITNEIKCCWLYYVNKIFGSAHIGNRFEILNSMLNRKSVEPNHKLL